MIISLTDDLRQVDKLRRKFAEYQERLRYQAPEVDPLETYKHAVLKTLLITGQVDEEELRKRFSAVSWYEPRALHTAMKIIAAYNSGDLSSIRGGTGLK